MCHCLLPSQHTASELARCPGRAGSSWWIWLPSVYPLMYNILCLHLAGNCTWQKIWKWVGTYFHGGQKEPCYASHQQNWALRLYSVGNYLKQETLCWFHHWAGTCPWNHIFSRNIHRISTSVFSQQTTRSFLHSTAP